MSSLPNRMVLLLVVGGRSSLRSLLSWPRLLESARSRLELLLASTASWRGCPFCCWLWAPRSASFTCGSGSCSCEVLRELPIRNLSLKGAMASGPPAPPAAGWLVVVNFLLRYLCYSNGHGCCGRLDNTKSTEEVHGLRKLQKRASERGNGEREGGRQKQLYNTVLFQKW